jgi:DNA-binding NarL/FixJ family response regulator
MNIRIAVVDDKPQNRYSTAEKLKLYEDIELTLTAENGADFLDQMKKLEASQHPNAVLMDIEMPVMNGIDAVRIGSQLYPDVKFLMLTVFDDDDKIFEAIKAGAGGYMLKDEKLSVVIDCVYQLVQIGGAPMSPRIARKALDLLMKSSFENVENDSSSGFQHNLSSREIEVLKLMVDAYDYREIAEKLFLSSNTVRKHIANIYDKLHVTSKAQAIKIATNNKLI